MQPFQVPEPESLPNCLAPGQEHTGDSAVPVTLHKALTTDDLLHITLERVS